MDTRTHYIYKFTSPVGKCYIGRTVNVEDRYKCHKWYYNRKYNRIIYNAMHKYGWDAFTFEVIDEVIGLENAIMKELEYIIKYDSIRNGYNQVSNTGRGGDVWDGHKHTEKYMEFVENMSSLMQGENNPMYGKSHSEEAKQKQKEKAKGRFSLKWFQERYGEVEGEEKYEDRCLWLKTRNMKKDPTNGRFAKE